MEDAAQEIAIVVQILIRADYSGVLFTADPVTDDLMRMMGNFVQGLGEALVAGQTNPQTFTLVAQRGHTAGQQNSTVPHVRPIAMPAP